MGKIMCYVRLIRREARAKSRTKKVRFVDYYDLIELPDGKHIPVPIAIRLVGLKEVLKIPVSRKKIRDKYFYWCPDCAEFYDEDYEGSFFKCRWHSKDYNSDNFKAKEAAFLMLIKNKQYHKLRYIEAVYWASPGAAKIVDGKIENIKEFEKLMKLRG